MIMCVQVSSGQLVKRFVRGDLYTTTYRLIFHKHDLQTPNNRNNYVNNSSNGHRNDGNNSNSCNNSSAASLADASNALGAVSVSEDWSLPLLCLSRIDVHRCEPHSSNQQQQHTHSHTLKHRLHFPTHKLHSRQQQQQYQQQQQQQRQQQQLPDRQLILFSKDGQVHSLTHSLTHSLLVFILAVNMHCMQMVVMSRRPLSLCKGVNCCGYSCTYMCICLFVIDVLFLSVCS